MTLSLRHLPLSPKPLYRWCKWLFLFALSRGRINRMLRIDPRSIAFGQKPESQFPPKRFLGGYRKGDWDQQIIPVEEHLLYRSYVQHFREGIPWKSTPFFRFALESIEEGKPFRGEYDSPQALQRRFEKCDRLYAAIEKGGYKSNHQLYEEGKIDNILELMDEVTVNIGRDGHIILNDGWHRFATARLLGIPRIPVRLCAQHLKSKSLFHPNMPFER